MWEPPAHGANTFSHISFCGKGVKLFHSHWLADGALLAAGSLADAAPLTTVAFMSMSGWPGGSATVIANP